MVNKKVGLYIAFFVVLHLLLNFFGWRIDFTKEKRYTLTPRTRELLGEAKKNITVTVFLDGEMPAAFRRLKNATADLLEDYKRQAGVNFKVMFVDPMEDVQAGDQDRILGELDEIGIKPVAVQLKSDAGITQKMVFPMALVEIDGKPMALNLLQKSGGPATNYEENITNSIQNLEYSFSSAIQSLLSGQIIRVGFTEGKGEPTNLALYDAITSLGQRFQVGRVDLSLINKEGLDSLKMLVVANPRQPFSEADKYKLNYFVMKGGSLIWLIDQVAMDLEQLRDGGQHLASNNDLNLNDMLFEYGVRVNYDLIADLNSSMIPVSSGAPGQAQIGLAPWIYYPILLPDTSHNLVKHIDGVQSSFTSTVDTLAIPNLKKTVILYTSPFVKVFNTPKMMSLQMINDQPDPKTFNQGSKITGVLLEGNFKSVFLNRPLPQGITTAYTNVQSSKLAKMVVIGDGSIFTNQVSESEQMPFPLGYDRYTKQNFGNKTLLLNLADYLTSDKNLIELRNKDIKERLLNKMLLRTEKTKWQFISACLPLLLLIFFATFQHYYRKHKYAK